MRCSKTLPIFPATNARQRNWVTTTTQLLHNIDFGNSSNVHIWFLGFVAVANCIGQRLAVRTKTQRISHCTSILQMMGAPMEMRGRHTKHKKQTTMDFNLVQFNHRSANPTINNKNKETSREFQNELSIGISVREFDGDRLKLFYGELFVHLFGYEKTNAGIVGHVCKTVLNIFGVGRFAEMHQMDHFLRLDGACVTPTSPKAISHVHGDWNLMGETQIAPNSLAKSTENKHNNLARWMCVLIAFERWYHWVWTYAREIHMGRFCV